MEEKARQEEEMRKAAEAEAERRRIEEEFKALLDAEEEGLKRKELEKRRL